MALAEAYFEPVQESKKVIRCLCTSFMHIPVLRQSVAEFLNLHSSNIAVDGTLGLGGHCENMLRVVGEKGHIYAFDQDESHILMAKQRLASFSSYLTIFHSNFAQMKDCLQSVSVSQVDSILFDLGLASPHVDRSERGFSFSHEGPLDMRYSQTLTSLTAADLVNHASVRDLQRIFFQYGQEPYARKIAQEICSRREVFPFRTTQELADFIVDLTPRFKIHKIHPATKVFQALRIAVNNELEVLEEVLPQTLDLLRPGGRLVVISYHSLEDRIVKHFLKSQSVSCICPPEILRCKCSGKPVLKILTKKPVIPSEQEICENPRSRSAKLRAAEKN